MKILSFGAGVQTTAMVILAVQGKLDVDVVIFADTGCEKPETYFYMDSYTLPLLKQANIPFMIAHPTNHYGTSLYDYLWRYSKIPHMKTRECSGWFKRRPIERIIGKDADLMIGFSLDELQRSEKPIHQDGYKRFPLIEMGITAADCHRIIKEYGWPHPLKSSCFFCPFQRWTEWNWLKQNHPGLLHEAVLLENHFYEKKPHLKNEIGLFGGKPLWKFEEGIQFEFGFPEEYSCWSGYCSH